MPGAGGSSTVLATTERTHQPIWHALSIITSSATTQTSLLPAATVRSDDSMSDDKGGDLKHCPGCGLRKPLSQFHRNKSKPDAHASNCKTCANAGVQRKRQAKRELDAHGAPQQHHGPRRHTSPSLSAILDVAAAAHQGGSDGELPLGGSPGSSSGMQHGYSGQSSLPQHLFFGGCGGISTAGPQAPFSGGFPMSAAPLPMMGAASPARQLGSAGYGFGAQLGVTGDLHAAHALPTGQSLQQALAAQQQAQLSAQHNGGAEGCSPFTAAAAASAAPVPAGGAGGSNHTKQCRNCYMERAAGAHFDPSPQEPDGLSTNCRTCTAAINLLTWVQQEAEMAKLTLQQVRAQHGDNSPAALMAFQSAVGAHNAYIQALAAMRPQQQPDAAAAAGASGPVAAAVAALVAAQQEQAQLLALQQAQQQQAQQRQQQGQQQQQQQHQQLLLLLQSQEEVRALALAQLQQQQAQQAQQQQQQQGQQQAGQAQQHRLQLQLQQSVGRPSPQRSALPAVVATGAAAAAAVETQPGGSPAVPQPDLQAVARHLSLSPPTSAATGGVAPSASTNSLATGGGGTSAGGGSAAGSPTASAAPHRAPTPQQRSCFACGKPSAGGFPLPMCEDCQNAGPITSAAGAAAASRAPAEAAAKLEPHTSANTLAPEASGKLMALGTLQGPLSSRSFSSTSSRSTTAQQLLALGGWASEQELGGGPGLSVRLASGASGASATDNRSDEQRLRDVLTGAGLTLGCTGSGAGSLRRASQVLPPSALPAPAPETAAADAATKSFSAMLPPPHGGLAAILQQAAARGEVGGKQTATRRVSWGATAACTGGSSPTSPAAEAQLEK